MNKECMNCGGKCCIDTSIEVYGVNDVPLEYLNVRNNAFYMKKKKDHKTCIALTEDGLCSIYDSRPSVCRDFTVGCTFCNNLRNIK
jgi:Fe-S-cluster containining protein